MLTKNETFQIGWEILERLLPQSHARRRPPPTGNYPIEGMKTPSAASSPPVPGGPAPLPTIREIINQLRPLPPYSALLGVCEDGLPFLFDLSDPSPGSILITGEASSGKSSLLRTILASASAMNHTEQVMFNLICPNSGLFSDLSRLSHCISNVSTYDRASSELVIDLAKIAEQRKSGRQRGPVIILAIDDLATLLSYNEFELYSHLKWLVKHGPDSGLWPVAILRSGRLNKYSKRLLNEFGTHLVGMPASRALSPSADGGFLNSGTNGQFETYVNGQGVRFWNTNVG